MNTHDGRPNGSDGTAVAESPVRPGPDAAASLLRMLAVYGRRLRRYRVLRGAGRLFAAAVPVLIVVGAACVWLRPGRAVCAVLGAMGWAALAAGVWRLVLRPLVAGPGPGQLARDIESRLSGLSDVLSSAVAFAHEPGAGRDGTSSELKAETVARAARRLADIRPEALLPLRGLRQAGVKAALALLALLGAAVLAPRETAAALRKLVLLSARPWPTRTHLALVSAPAAPPWCVPAGEDLPVTVQADPAGTVPRRVEMRVRYPRGSRTERHWLSAVDANHFQGTIQDLRERALLTIRGGDATIGPMEIVPVQRPRITGLRLVCTPPRHVGPAPYELDASSGVAEVPAGSVLAVEVQSDQPLDELLARLVATGAGASATAPETRSVRATGMQGTGTVPPLKLNVTRAVLLSLRGRRKAPEIESDPPVTIEIRPVPDRVPKVTVAALGVADAVTPDAWFDVEVRATDDYGITKIELEAVAVSPGGTAVLLRDTRTAARPVPAPGPEAARLDLAAFRPAPGTSIELRGTAWDNDTMPEPKEGRSETGSLKVLSRNDYLAAMLLRQQTCRLQIESLIERQAELGRVWTDKSAKPGDMLVRRGQEALRADTATLAGVAAAVDAILAEFVHNRIIREDGRYRYRTTITDEMRRMIGPGGSLARCLDLLRGPGPVNEAGFAAQVDAAGRDLRTIRSRLLLMETYSGVLGAIEDLAERQKANVERTRKDQLKLLDQFR